MFQAQLGLLTTLRPDLHDFARPVADLTDGVEQHVATGPGLGVEVTLVEDVAVVQVPHQLQGPADTDTVEAGEEREDTGQS